jgi:YHS domain-containing protein
MKSLLSLFALFHLCLANLKAQSPEKIIFNNVDKQGIILDGYDAVAFFTENKPVKGSPEFSFTYQDAVYNFSTPKNLELFRANPDKYKPQFGGWCAYAVSLGHTAPVDVNTFSIVDGRLVLQHNQRAVDGWNKDVAGNLKKADKYWPAVVSNRGKQIITDEEKAYLNNTDKQGITLQGYDAVAYFKEGAAVKGDPGYTARYRGATYWFVSQENAELFKNQPEKYAPQYGSFCGYAMSIGKLRPVDPTIFQIYEGRLILQHTKDAYEKFNHDLSGSISKADKNWPGQVKKHAGKKVRFDKPAKPSGASLATHQ